MALTFILHTYEYYISTVTGTKNTGLKMLVIVADIRWFIIQNLDQGDGLLFPSRKVPVLKAQTQ